MLEFKKAEIKADSKCDLNHILSDPESSPLYCVLTLRFFCFHESYISYSGSWACLFC